MADRTRYFTKTKTILLYHTLSFVPLKHLIKEHNRFKYLLKRNCVPYAYLNFDAEPWMKSTSLQMLQVSSTEKALCKCYSSL